MALQVPTVTIDDLRQFHAKHFPHTSIPEIFFQGYEADVAHQDFYAFDEEGDELGYYPDGMKRTLNDEDIAFLRRSEIQSILREKRRRRDEGDNAFGVRSTKKLSSSARHAFPIAVEPDSSHPSPSSVLPHPSLPTTESAEKVSEGQVENPQSQQWIKSSAKTKARNARNRKKNRLNHRARKKEEKKKRDQNRQEDKSEDEESDEWDPWHQANGPDVQKDNTVDLDY